VNEFALIYNALPDDLGTRLAEIADVRPAKIDLFKNACRGLIADAIRNLQREKVTTAALKELEGVLKDARGLHTRLARLKAAALRQFESYGLFGPSDSDEILWNLDALGIAAGRLAKSRMRRVCPNAASLDQNEWQDDPVLLPHHEMAAIAAALMPALSDLAVDTKAAKRSLRGNQNEHRLARELIMALEYLAVSMGGSFGLDHHPRRDGPTGSLVDALTLLKNHFPKGFFPKIKSTMQSDLRRARRRAAGGPILGA
jgi:hypothetical protein